MANRPPPPRRPRNAPGRDGRAGAKKTPPADAPAAEPAPSREPRALSPAELKLRKSAQESTLFQTLSATPPPLPDVPAPSLDGLCAALPPPEPVTAEELMERLESKVRAQLGRERVAGEAIAPGDNLTLDLVAFSDGRAVPFGSEEETEVVFEEAGLGPGLFAALRGAKVGGSVRAELVLAPDHPVAELRGKPALAAVHVLRATEPPQFDPASPGVLGPLGLGKTLDEAFARLAEEAQEERTDALAALAQNLVLAELVTRIQGGELPKALVDHEIGRLWYQSEGQLLLKLDVPAEDREHGLRAWLASPAVRAEVEHKLRVTQALRAVALSHEVAVTAEDVRQAVAEGAAVAGADLEAIAREAEESPELVTQLTNALLYQRTLELVMSRVEVRIEEPGRG